MLAELLFIRKAFKEWCFRTTASAFRAGLPKLSYRANVAVASFSPSCPKRPLNGTCCEAFRRSVLQRGERGTRPGRPRENVHSGGQPAFYQIELWSEAHGRRARPMASVPDSWRRGCRAVRVHSVSLSAAPGTTSTLNPVPSQ